MALYEEKEIRNFTFDPRQGLRLVSYLKPYRLRVLTALCLMCLSAIVGQIGPRLTQIIVDDHVLQGDMSGSAWTILLFFLSIALYYILQYSQTLITEMTAQYVMRDIRRHVFTHLQRLPIRYFDQTPLGRIITRATNDVETLSKFFSEGIVSGFMDLFILIAIIAFMAHMDIELTFICSTIIPILFIGSFYLQGSIMKAYRELRFRLARLNVYLEENISGIEVVQLFNRQKRNLREFDHEHLPYRRAAEREIHYFAILFPFNEFIGNLGMALIIWYGASLVSEERIALGVLVAFLQYVRRFFPPIMNINDRYALMQNAMAASERIFELLDSPAESRGGPRCEIGTDHNGSIEFRNVHFKYDPDDDEFVLKGVSFQVQAGQSVALVGATGSGKTTIINLLCRFYEIQEGTILVDGRDVRTWHVEDLRRRFGIVQQDVLLFSGDITNNIRLGNRYIDSQRVEIAARFVNADSFIRRLAKGYEHPVTEGGSTLSVGERQILAFARALVIDPEILILDEATSSIDPETEELIQDAMGKLMQGRTSIIIAHRLSTIRSADQILVMHRGEIRERGRHEDLVRQDGIYARLHQLYQG
ncbi:MAG: ABC transporter ATP-binding protein [Gemmatimonadota bacterium]|nr:ABC transporter ATP-binding protein [Gemmatimonadota bacterium]